MNNNVGTEALRVFSEFGREALKASMIINGGASLALLAFVGNIFGKLDDRAATEILIYALFSFCSGVLFTGISSFFFYRARYFAMQRANSIDHMDEQIKEVKKYKMNERDKNKSINQIIKDHTKTIEIPEKKVMRNYIWINILLIMSYFSFFIGVFIFGYSVILYT